MGGGWRRPAEAELIAGGAGMISGGLDSYRYAAPFAPAS